MPRKSGISATEVTQPVKTATPHLHTKPVTDISHLSPFSSPFPSSSPGSNLPSVRGLAQHSSRRPKNLSPRGTGRKRAIEEMFSDRSAPVFTLELPHHEKDRLMEIYDQNHDEALSFWGVHSMLASCGIMSSPDFLEESLVRIGITNPSSLSFISPADFVRLVHDIMFRDENQLRYFETDAQLLDLVMECEFQEDGSLEIAADNSGNIPVGKLQSLLQRFDLDGFSLFKRAVVKIPQPREATEVGTKKKTLPPLNVVPYEKFKLCLFQKEEEHELHRTPSLACVTSALKSLMFNRSVAETRRLSMAFKTTNNAGSTSPRGNKTPNCDGLKVNFEPVTRSKSLLHNAMQKIKMAQSVSQSLTHLLDFSKYPNAGSMVAQNTLRFDSVSSNAATGGAGLRANSHVSNLGDESATPREGTPSENIADDEHHSTPRSPSSPFEAQRKASSAAPPEPEEVFSNDDFFMSLSIRLHADYDIPIIEVPVMEMSVRSVPGAADSTGTKLGLASTAAQSLPLTESNLAKIEEHAPELSQPFDAVYQPRTRAVYNKPWNEKPVSPSPKKLTKLEIDQKTSMRMSEGAFLKSLETVDNDIIKSMDPRYCKLLSPSSHNSSKALKLSPLKHAVSPLKNVLSPRPQDPLMSRWVTI